MPTRPRQKEGISCVTIEIQTTEEQVQQKMKMLLSGLFCVYCGGGKRKGEYL